MFFILAKTVGFFSAPSNVLITLALLGVLLMATRFARAGRRLAVFAVIGLGICGLTPFGNAIILPLEERFPPWDAARGAPAGIISLGGALDTVVSPVRNEVALNEAAERMTVMAELARRYPQARIVFSGGSGRLIFAGVSEASLAARLFESFGIAKERITLEDKSRDTWRTRASPGSWCSPSPASAGCWSPRRTTCRARSGCSARKGSRSRPIRSITAPVARSTCCDFSRPSATGCAAPTPRRANGSGCWSIG